MEKKKIKVKYSKAFRKEDAKHYLIYRVLERRKVAMSYQVAAEILEELEILPR